MDGLDGRGCVMVHVIRCMGHRFQDAHVGTYKSRFWNAEAATDIADGTLSL